MIRVILTLGASEELLGFEASGHAGCGAFGSDIICSAVSFLLRTVALTLGPTCEVKAETRGAFSLKVKPESISVKSVQGLPAKTGLVSLDNLKFTADFLCKGLNSIIEEKPGSVEFFINKDLKIF